MQTALTPRSISSPEMFLARHAPDAANCPHQCTPESHADMRPLPELAPVFAELTPVFDPWELANWFAQPNPWLADCTPADTLHVNPPGVLHAARADRFVATG